MSATGHAAPWGTAAVAAPAQSPVPLALGMPDRNSWLILAGFLAALVLLVWLLARTVRKLGGFRRTCRRIAWETRMTARAFTAPLRAYLRHRRCARILAAYFADPAAHDLLRTALDRADAAAGDGCHAPAAQLTQAGDRVRVVVAGRDPAGSAGPVLPWADAADEPGEWTWAAPAGAVRDRTGPGRPVRLPLVLGVDRKAPGVVVVDWLRGPAALAVEGDARVSRSVLQALAAQVDRMPDGPPVVVASGVHPRFPGRPLDDVLAELAAAGPEAAAEAVPVIVCWAPTPAQAARLAELCARGQARVLAGGRLPGACWVLHAETDGRLLGPGPQVDVESPALGRSVARAVRRGLPAPYSVLPDAGTGTGTDDGPGVPAGPVRETAPQKPEFRKPEPEPRPAPEPEPAPVPDRGAPAPGPAAAVSRPEPPAVAREAGFDTGFDADFAEPEPGTPAPAAPAATASVPTPAQRTDAPEHTFAAHTGERPAQAEDGTGRTAEAGSPAGADFAEPDLAEPRPAAAPGLAGVSAASNRSDADSDPADPGDPQERTPRNP
ncbi:hypothetical protein [Streptomyces sp. NPDC017529]|uniref:hypothetical protein n=1 Tax=Streptomyces sp. NPDC017529 TaxID=3365000 RepID=UPI0037A77F19